MSPRTTYLSRLIGISLVLYAIFMLVNAAVLTAALASLREPPQILLWGTLLVFSGVAFILAHNRWSGGALTIAVTVIGWLTLLKGLAILYVPPSMQAPYIGYYETYSQLYAAAAFLLGAWLSYEGWKRSSAAGNGAEIAP